MAGVELPLFPLRSVLFPGGRLALRVFEPRYLDLVRDSLRNGDGFGICLILDGEEVGAPAVPAAVGTLARIVDFNSAPDGLLGIVVEGGERFRVERTRVRDNGLVIGKVAFCAAEPVCTIAPEHALLATILERLHERIGGDWSQTPRERYDDGAWVGWRLAEALPLEAHERQHLLQLDEPAERLVRLLHHLPRFQRG